MFDVFCGVSGGLHVPGNLLYHTGDIIRSEVRFFTPSPRIQLEIRRNSPRSSWECKVAAEEASEEAAARRLTTVRVIFCTCVCNNAHICACVPASSRMKEL